MIKFLKHILISFGLYPDATLEERLNKVLSEQKRRNFLDDITRIRNAGDYIPDYNIQPKYTEYNLSYKGKEIKWKPKLTALPKVSYKTMEEWKEAIHIEAKKLNSSNYNKPVQLNILFSNQSL